MLQTPKSVPLLSPPRKSIDPVGVSADAARVVLSFDVEEHYRIEAAAHLRVSPESQVYYRNRMEVSTHWLLDQLAARDVKATFYVVGELAHLSPDLVKAISRAGHEVGSHGWDHRRILTMDPETFRQDVRKCKDALEQVTGLPVSGYRAPTFSVVRQTIWALEVLAEVGYLYDSSIYPVHHDRYGIPEVPLTPFTVRTKSGPMLELPLLTLRWLGLNLPVGGGGYFRLLPSWFMTWGIRQMSRRGVQNPAMLYFHPWEFDAEQERLPLSRSSRFRTYTGIRTSQRRLQDLLGAGHRFERAADIARDLRSEDMPRFELESILEGVFTLA
jgi:polysaccharide deacetylase family protein (PEP-CTERM system associated)